MNRLWQIFLSIFEYYTPKVVVLTNRKIGVLSRFIQLSIILYIAVYVLYWKKGYQQFSPIQSTSFAKLKGVVYPNFSDDEYNPIVLPNIRFYRRVWDVADYVVYPNEDNAFFVMTNVIITPQQTESRCPEDFNKKGAICRSDSDCPKGYVLPGGNGPFTGSCIISDWDSTYHVCEIYGWCPVERDVVPLLNGEALLAESKHFTVLIKHFALFTSFNVKLRNIPNYLHNFNCINKDMPACPIFRLKDIVPGDYNEMAAHGASVVIEIAWDCDFDYDPQLCVPKYIFKRMDIKYEIASGQNFRFAHYYSNVERTLFKAYGIRFEIITTGKAGKFSFIPLLLNIGSGLGLLAVATVFCDIIVLYLVPRREFYYHKKYQDVVDKNVSRTHDSGISNQNGGETSSAYFTNKVKKRPCERSDCADHIFDDSDSEHLRD